METVLILLLFIVQNIAWFYFYSKKKTNEVNSFGIPQIKLDLHKPSIIKDNSGTHQFKNEKGDDLVDAMSVSGQEMADGMRKKVMANRKK